MRIYGPSGTRDFPTDRSPTRIWVAAVAGHAGGTSGTVATYTVPAGRRFLGTVAMAYEIDTALGAAQAARVELGSNITGNFRLMAGPGDGPGVHESIAIPAVTLVAGDVVSVLWEVDAGVGVINATGYINGVEYAA